MLDDRNGKGKYGRMSRFQRQSDAGVWWDEYSKVDQVSSLGTGVSHTITACTFSGSVASPSAGTWCPGEGREVCRDTHFVGLLALL